MQKSISKSWRALGFWFVVIPVVAILAVLMLQMALVAWTVITSPYPVAPSLDLDHRIAWASLDMMVLEGDDFAQLLGWLLAIGLLGGMIVVVLRLLFRKH